MWNTLALLGAMTLAIVPHATNVPESADHERAQAETKAKISLLTENLGAVPGGSVTLGVVFDIPKDWHIYYDGQNDTGQPPEILTDKLPAGYTLGQVQWPAPERHVLPGNILDHIYEKKATLLVTLNVPKDAKPGPVTIELPVKWMECAKECRLADAKVTASLTVVAKPADIKPAPAAKDIAEARKRLPGELPKDASIKVLAVADSLTITARGADAIVFIPHSGGVQLKNPLRDGEAKGDTLIAALNTTSKDAHPHVVGILEVTKGNTTSAYLVDTRPKSK